MSTFFHINNFFDFHIKSIKLRFKEKPYELLILTFELLMKKRLLKVLCL